METIAGYLADLGVDAAKEFLSRKIDEKQLRESLIEYIERQRKYNEVCSLAEEIDFQGLVEYIRNNLVDDVIKRISCVSSKERGVARQNVIDAAVSFSKANTPEAKERVAKITSICLDIIRGFYKKRIDAKYYILASDVVDAVNENTNLVIASAKDEVVNTLRRIEKASGSPYSLENLAEQAQDGNLDTVNQRLKVQFGVISNEHPLYPYYGYGWKDNALVSEPLNSEASKRFPVRYTFNGPVKVGDKYISDPNIDIFNYAYRHQLQLVMKVEDAKKYLGDIVDPAQYEVKKLVGGELHAKPPEFPPAFACSIKVKDQVFFDYVLIRTQEILDDGTYVFSNIEQPNTHIWFEFRINAKDLFQNNEGRRMPVKGNTGFTISIKDATNAEILKYAKFSKAVNSDRELRLHILKSDQDLVAGTIDCIDYSTGFKDIDEEIDFLERICDIEKYYNLSFHINGEISEKEYRTVCLLSNLIRNNEVEKTWNNASFTGIIDQQFRERLISAGADACAISYVGIELIEMFGESFELKYMRTYYDAIMEDYERVIQLAELSKDGDPIRITFNSGTNGKEITTLNMPENMLDIDEKKLNN